MFGLGKGNKIYTTESAYMNAYTKKGICKMDSECGYKESQRKGYKKEDGL